MIGDFPPHVQATVRRILDAEARRLLAERGAFDADELERLDERYVLLGYRRRTGSECRRRPGKG
jgi:hypothetical protein